MTELTCPECGDTLEFVETFRRVADISRAGADGHDPFLQKWNEYHCRECDKLVALMESDEYVGDSS